MWAVEWDQRMKLQWLRLWQQLAPACKSAPLYQSL